MKTESEIVDEIVVTAQNFSMKLEQSFIAHVQKAQSKVKESGDNGMKILALTMSEYLIGTTVALLSEFLGKEQEHENYVVEMVKDKFRIIRQAAKNADG